MRLKRVLKHSLVPPGLLISALCFISGCDDAHYTELRGNTMGTTYRVQFLQPAGSVTPIKTGVVQILDRINWRMSTYLPASEVSRINQWQEREWLSISLEMAVIVEQSLRIGELTNGAFSIMVEPLVDLWGFSATARAASPPDSSSIDRARALTGHTLIEVRFAPPGIRKKSAAVAINLSAIAKGYAVDLIVEFLEQHRVSNYFVQIGGEIRVGGKNPQGSAWLIGIEQPSQPMISAPQVASSLRLYEGAVSTSGNYRNYFEWQGVNYSHLIDPRTGWPVRHLLTSVTVVHQNSAFADALATALMIMGQEEGFKWALKHKIKALFIEQHNSKTILHATPLMEELRVDQ